MRWRCPRTGQIFPAGLTQQVKPKCQFSIHCFFNALSPPKLRAHGDFCVNRLRLLNLAVWIINPLKDYTMDSLSRATSNGALVVIDTPAAPAHTADTARVLRNTYALLSLTLLFSAAVAALPAPVTVLPRGHRRP